MNWNFSILRTVLIFDEKLWSHSPYFSVFVSLSTILKEWPE